MNDPVDINKLSGNIAKATCTALVKLLDLLATAGLTKLGVRATIHSDNVNRLYFICTSLKINNVRNCITILTSRGPD